MKKIIAVSALITSALFSTSVFAQAKNFEGFTAGVNISSVGASTKINGADDFGGFNLGEQSVVPSLEIGYNAAIGNKFVLGVTATYDLAESKSGQVTDFFQLKAENHYSINLKPGFAVTDSTLIYATVGYNQMTGKVTGNSITTNNTNFSGIGYGIGSMILLDKNIFVKLEVQQIDYSSKSNTIDGTSVSYKPSATVGTIGFGYKF